MLNSNTWNYFTARQKWVLARLKIKLPANYSFTNHVFDIYVYKQDLVLSNLQRLICLQTQPTSIFFFQNRSINIIMDPFLFYLGLS